MILTLTDKQWQEIRQGAPPVRLVDPETKVPYAMVREDTLRKLHELFADGPLSKEERAVILRGVWERAQWDDPAMEDYSALDPRRKS